MSPFRSGYVNVACEEAGEGLSPAASAAYPAIANAPLETPGYRHEALFYRGDEEFLAGTVPLVRDAIDADAAVLVAVPALARAC